MDLYICISVLSLIHTWITCTVQSAPTGQTPTASTASTVSRSRSARTKRCSCATFLDKECVYFCHLDIIWVNTPERVVSYGLGNAPRTRRAVADSMATGGGARCRCLRDSDASCRRFCHLDSAARYDTSAERAIRPAGDDGCSDPLCKQPAAADTGRMKTRGGRKTPAPCTNKCTRTGSSSEKQVSPVALSAAMKTHLLLDKWRVRQRHRAREWEGESTAS